MFETVMGLPVHILVIHAVVVLVPLAAVGVLLYAFVPKWRATLRWPVLAVATAGFIATPIAYVSGGELQELLGLEEARDVQRHAEFGLRTLIAVTIWWIVVALVLGVAARASAPATVLLVVLVLMTAVTTAGVVVTGHTGSEAVWGTKLLGR
jgi:hypothetical protein